MAAKEPLVLSILINQSTLDWKGGLQQISKVSKSGLFEILSAKDTEPTFDMKNPHKSKYIRQV